MNSDEIPSAEISSNNTSSNVYINNIDRYPVDIVSFNIDDEYSNGSERNINEEDEGEIDPSYTNIVISNTDFVFSRSEIPVETMLETNSNISLSPSPSPSPSRPPSPMSIPSSSVQSQLQSALQETEIPSPPPKPLSWKDMEAILHTASLLEEGRLGPSQNFAYARELIELLQYSHPENSIPFFIEKANEGAALAQTSLGLSYQHGIGVKEDEQKSRELYGQAAASGNARGFTLLGLCPPPFQPKQPSSNKLRLADDKKSSHFQPDQYQHLLQGHERGDIRSTYHLATHLLETSIKKTSPQTKTTPAQHLFQQAYHSKHQLDLPEQKQLGDRYMDGDGIPESKARGIELLHPTSRKEYAPALTSLGIAFRQGEGVDEDALHALHFFKRAVELEKNVDAAYYAGNMHLEGEDGVEHSSQLAVRFFAIGSEQGDEYCKRELAYLYEEGNGVVTDLIRACRLYREADGYNSPDRSTFPQECVVCMEVVERMMVLFPCGHQNLCMECCWRQNIQYKDREGAVLGRVAAGCEPAQARCPTCRKDIKCCLRQQID